MTDDTSAESLILFLLSSGPPFSMAFTKIPFPPHSQTPKSIISRFFPITSLSLNGGGLFLPPHHQSEVVIAIKLSPPKYRDPTIPPPKPPDGLLYRKLTSSCSPFFHAPVWNRSKTSLLGATLAALAENVCRLNGAVDRCRNDGRALHVYDLEDEESLEPIKEGWMPSRQGPKSLMSKSLKVTGSGLSRVRQQWSKRYFYVLKTASNLLGQARDVSFSAGCLFQGFSQVWELHKNSLLSLGFKKTLLLILNCTGLGEVSKDHHHHNKILKQIEMHNNICLLVSPMPSTASLLGTERCIDKLRCNCSNLSEELRSGKSDQEGSGNTLDEGSDPMLALGDGKIQQGRSCSSIQVEWHEVSRPGRTPRPPAKPPDCSMIVLLPLRSHVVGLIVNA